MQQLIIQPIVQPKCPPTNLPTYWPTNQPIHQPTYPITPIADLLTNQPTYPANRQPTNRPTLLTNGPTDPPTNRQVSAGYAEEIKTYLGGWGMEGLLESRNFVLNGITNGIDMGGWLAG